jgi:hypothetical protein
MKPLVGNGLHDVTQSHICHLLCIPVKMLRICSKDKQLFVQIVHLEAHSAHVFYTHIYRIYIKCS